MCSLIARVAISTRPLASAISWAAASITEITCQAAYGNSYAISIDIVCQASYEI
jgi:hypothetical protein